jgi:hypothetical protein
MLAHSVLPCGELCVPFRLLHPPLRLPAKVLALLLHRHTQLLSEALLPSWIPPFLLSPFFARGILCELQVWAGEMAFMGMGPRLVTIELVQETA